MKVDLHQGQTFPIVAAPILVRRLCFFLACTSAAFKLGNCSSHRWQPTRPSSPLVVFASDAELQSGCLHSGGGCSLMYSAAFTCMKSNPASSCAATFLPCSSASKSLWKLSLPLLLVTKEVKCSASSYCFRWRTSFSSCFAYELAVSVNSPLDWSTVWFFSHLNFPRTVAMYCVWCFVSVRTLKSHFNLCALSSPATAGRHQKSLSCLCDSDFTCLAPVSFQVASPFSIFSCIWQAACLVFFS